LKHDTEDLPAYAPQTSFWGSRRNRVASAAGALLLAVAASTLLLGGGNSGLVWLTGRGPSWLPFAGSVSWLHSGFSWLSFGSGPKHPGGSPSPSPSGVALVSSPSPTPTAKPSPAPTAQPSPTPTPTPTPKPTATPTPTPRPSPTPTPTATPTHEPTPTPTPSPSPTPHPSPSPGTVLFEDNFEQDALGPSAAGWRYLPTGSYKVAMDGSHVLQTSSTGFPVADAGSGWWTDYKVSADVRTNPTNGHARVIARRQSNGYFYACGLDHPGLLFLGKEYGGTWYTFTTSTYDFTSSTPYHIDFSVQGNTLTCTVSDPTSSTHTATLQANVSYFAHGDIGASGEYGEFDNFEVIALP
jgi:hypothetical protein